MKRSKKEKLTRLFLQLTAILIVLTMILSLVQIAFAATQISLIIDNQTLTSSPSPIMVNNRVMVPLRLISEELGAQVEWNSQDKSVYIVKGDRTVLLRINRHLIEYTVSDNKEYDLNDVVPAIYSGRTFVPLRLVSNALGVGIQWDSTTHTVRIDSDQTSSITPLSNMKISSLSANELVKGSINLQTSLPSPLPADAVEIKYLLLNPADGNGFVIARGTDLGAVYPWLPAVRDNGKKILVAVLFDKNGKFLVGDALPIQVGIVPNIALSGLSQNQTLTSSVDLKTASNFSIAYVKYEIVNGGNNKTLLTSEQDPYGTYQWTPTMEFNGAVTVKTIAYDQKGQSYNSPPININVNMARKLTLGGVKSGQSIDKPVTLSASRNFTVMETEYILRDVSTGLEKSLAKTVDTSYVWFPGPTNSGEKELYVRVKGATGEFYESSPVLIYVPGTPKLLLQGAGPDQVITTAAAVNLKVTSNIPLKQVKFLMTNLVSGSQKVIATLDDPAKAYAYTPAPGTDGKWKIKAVGTDLYGKTINSDEVNVTIYTGKLYTAQPIIEKNGFLGLASKLAVSDFKKSGMSAALQTAQAILETGWGQSVPVDKYNGQLSYNLFGIKGTGTAGSVISNTWEEYNGVKYRIDAKFRAYYNVTESWSDHNRLLLTGTRYEPFRKVMFDSSLGAWALRRAGYATDSKYPVKLMDIIQRYQLEELDKVSI